VKARPSALVTLALRNLAISAWRWRIWRRPLSKRHGVKWLAAWRWRRRLCLCGSPAIAARNNESAGAIYGCLIGGRIEISWRRRKSVSIAAIQRLGSEKQKEKQSVAAKARRCESLKKRE